MKTLPDEVSIFIIIGYYEVNIYYLWTIVSKEAPYWNKYCNYSDNILQGAASSRKKHPDTMLPDRKVSICLIITSFLQETIHKPLQKKIKENRGKGEERGSVEVPQ